MRESDRYVKVVSWSEEDGCYVGMAPGLFSGGCHGDDQQAVFAELVQIVEEWIVHFNSRGEPLPPPTSGRIEQLLHLPAAE
jgi:predicted RNase H-like HicB family nuclease